MKYTDEQIREQFYAANMILKGTPVKDAIAKIDNGIPYSSNYMGVQNFLFILTNGERGLPNYTKQMLRIATQESVKNHRLA